MGSPLFLEIKREREGAALMKTPFLEVLAPYTTEVSNFCFTAFNLIPCSS